MGPRQISKDDADTWERHYHGLGTRVHRVAWWAGKLHHRFLGGNHTVPMLVRCALQRALRAWRSGFNAGANADWIKRGESARYAEERAEASQTRQAS